MNIEFNLNWNHITPGYVENLITVLSWKEIYVKLRGIIQYDINFYNRFNFEIYLFKGGAYFC